MGAFSRPRWNRQLIDIRSQDGSRERFQAWTAIKLLGLATIESITYTISVIASFGFAALHFPVVALNIAITVVLAHLAWYTVLKLEGGYGRRGLICAAAWLAVEPL